MLNDVAVLIAVASFLGAILGAGLSNLVTARLAGQERKENRRKARLESLVSSLNQLIDLRGSLQYLQGSNDNREKREFSYAKAYGIMLSLGDSAILEQAPKVMQGGGYDGTRNLKLDAIDFAIQRLGEIITAIENE
jgi:hypothetical protein